MAKNTDSHGLHNVNENYTKYPRRGSANVPMSHVQDQLRQKHIDSGYQAKRCQSPGPISHLGRLHYDQLTAKLNNHYSEVVVRYIGTLAMPKDCRVWDHRTQSVSNAVKRLKESRVTHTVVKIRMSADGIQLFDSRGKLLMHHGHQGIANFGLSPVDDSLFCLVTYDDDDENSGPSCQIFCVDPQTVNHEVHEKTAALFFIQCEINIDDNSCAEFPSSARSVVDLFRKFYSGTMSGSFCGTSSLNTAMFVPPGFEGQFNVSGLDESYDNANQQVAIITGCQSNEVFSSPNKKWTNDASYQKYLLKSKRISDEPDKTAVFPVGRILNGNDLKPSLSVAGRQYNTSSSSQTDAFNSLSILKVHDDTSLDQGINDSQNGVENLRKQSQKLLLHPESRGASLHVSTFSAYEKDTLDPESPMPALPLRTLTNLNNNSGPSNQRTSTPMRKQIKTARSHSIEVVGAFSSDRHLISDDESPCLERTLIFSEPSCADVNFPGRSERPPISVDGSSQSAQVMMKDLDRNITSEAKYSDNNSCKESDRKLVVEKHLKKNVSFHGSLESVFPGEGSQLGTKPPLGSCREITSPSHQEIGRAASWAVVFDKLLNDPDGVAIFREHLKKEFSEENLKFWLKCEEYKHAPEDQRNDLAAEIYRIHIDPDAQESVNIDQDIKNAVKNSLHLATVDIFDAAQRHIYQLMRQDCYPRFKTSQLYKDAVLAELEGRPFQVLNEENGSSSLNFMAMTDLCLKTERTHEDRRKSLLFWQKKKSDVNSKTEDEADERSQQGHGLVESETNRNSFDLKTAIDLKVTTSDGCVTQLGCHHGQKIADVLLTLGSKLNCNLNFVEAVNPSTKLVLDITKDVRTLSSKEILLVHCVVFRLTLPSEKSLAVRCQFRATVSKCIGPILKKCGFDIDKVVMHIAGEGVILKQKMYVDSLNCCHVLAESLSNSKGRKKKVYGAPARRLTSDIYKRSQNANSTDSSLLSSSKIQFHLQELFQDVFHGDVDFSCIVFDELGVFNLEKLNKSKGQRNNRFAFLSRGLSTESNRTSELVAKRPTSSAAEDESFINLLVSAQSRQLNNQRGKLKKEDVVLPDFLKEEPGETDRAITCQKSLHHYKTSSQERDNRVYITAADRFLMTPSVSSSSCSMSSSTDGDCVCSAETCSEESWSFENDALVRPSYSSVTPGLNFQFSELNRQDRIRNDIKNESQICSFKLQDPSKHAETDVGKHIDRLSASVDHSNSEPAYHRFIPYNSTATLPNGSKICQYKSSYV